MNEAFYWNSVVFVVGAVLVRICLMFNLLCIQHRVQSWTIPLGLTQLKPKPQSSVMLLLNSVFQS